MIDLEALSLEQVQALSRRVEVELSRRYRELRGTCSHGDGFEASIAFPRGGYYYAPGCRQCFAVEPGFGDPPKYNLLDRLVGKIVRGEIER